MLPVVHNKVTWLKHLLIIQINVDHFWVIKYYRFLHYDVLQGFQSLRLWGTLIMLFGPIYTQQLSQDRLVCCLTQKITPNT